MKSYQGLIPICRLDLILRSAFVILSKVHVNIFVIFGKVFFQIFLFFELCWNSVHMAKKNIHIFIQKGFKLSMTDYLAEHLQLFCCFTLVNNFNIFPSVISEIIFFYVVNDWRYLFVGVFYKTFRICRYECLFFEHFQF